MGYNNLDNNPFYNAVSEPVRKELQNRASIYSAEARGNEKSNYIHSWLYRKTAYVSVSYDGKTILEPPKKGFDEMYGNGLYPPAAITSVRITNEGDYGSLMKADISFTVYTLQQLEYFTKNILFVATDENLQPKMVTINYGWTAGNDGPEEEFYGFVYNYNWSLRNDGGFDCVSNLIGEGFFSLHTKIDASMSKNVLEEINRQLVAQATYQGAGTGAGTGNNIDTNTMYLSGNTTIHEFNWIDAIVNYTAAAPFVDTKLDVNSQTIGVDNTSENINEQNCVVVIPLPGKRDSKDLTNSQGSITYVTLEWICAAITKTLTFNSVSFAKHAYICNGNISRSWKYENLVSADPINILFPGYSKYGTASTRQTQDVLQGINNLTMDDGKTDSVDVSKILVSGLYLQTILEEMKKEHSIRSNFGDVDITVNNFFKKLFTKINTCSGGLYSLTICNPKVEKVTANDMNKWIVLDTSYNIGTTKITTIPVVVSAPGTGAYSSIVRSVNMSSTLPGELAAAQFVSAGSNLTTKSSFFFEKTKNKNHTILPKKPGDVRVALSETADAAYTSGFKPDDVVKLEAALADFRVYGILKQNNADLTDISVIKNTWRQGIPIPVNLSITMDGIKGFRFGNTIKIDYLPAVYKNVVFTVTKIEHEISNNDWKTTLSTVCRLKV